MTVDPNLDWLANDEGDLLPEAVRALEGQPDPPAAGRPAAPAPRGPRVAPQRPQQRRWIGVPPPRPVRGPSRAPFILGLFMTALGSGLLGALVAGSLFSTGFKNLGPTHERPTDAVSPSTGEAFVNGVNVNMRAGAGLGYPVVARLVDGEELHVRADSDGWYPVTTRSGISGYVFGAYVRGTHGSDRGPAKVARLLTFNSFPRVVLAPGQKVFRGRESDESSVVLLPDGRRLSVPAEALLDAD